MNTKAIFDHAAADYDGARRRLVPGFDLFYGTVLELIPFEGDARFTVLDLGAGTGLLSAMVAEAFPKAHLILADFSTEMLAQAQQRFQHRADFTYRVLDFENDALPGPYDVVVSALALHHTPPPKLPAVFRKVYDALPRGGLFINADQTHGASAANEQRYEAAWHRGVRAQGGTEQEIAAAVERMKADKTATLEDQLRCLHEAGFEGVECWYKHYRFAVYSGWKP